MGEAKMNQATMQKVDELIEMLADHIKEGINKGGLSGCYVEETRALAKLVSARAASFTLAELSPYQ